MFNDRRTATKTEQADWAAKLSGTYVSGPMAPRTEVETYIPEVITDEQRARIGQEISYEDEEGVTRTTRSGVFLLNI